MKYTPEELADLRRRADIADIFGEAQDMVDDNAGLYPSADCLEGVSPDYAEAMWAIYRKEKLTREKREGGHNRNRSGKRRAKRRSRRQPRRTVKLVCPVCRYEYLAWITANDKRIRKYCGNACKKKEYRIRRTLRKLGDNLERARPSADGI